MKNEYLISVENRLHGYHTRLKELHYSAPSFSIHKLIDEFDGALSSFDDEIMEDAQGIFGFIQPGELSPELPQETDFEALLRSIRVMLAEMKDQLQDKCYTGIINTVDDFWHTINKNIYLVKLAKHEAANAQ